MRIAAIRPVFTGAAAGECEESGRAGFKRYSPRTGQSWKKFDRKDLPLSMGNFRPII
jgi:hypothetical protein